MLDEVFREAHLDGHYTRKNPEENKNLLTAEIAESAEYWIV